MPNLLLKTIAGCFLIDLINLKLPCNLNPAGPIVENAPSQ